MRHNTFDYNALLNTCDCNTYVQGGDSTTQAKPWQTLLSPLPTVSPELRIMSNNISQSINSIHQIVLTFDKMLSWFYATYNTFCCKETVCGEEENLDHQIFMCDAWEIRYAYNRMYTCLENQVLLTRENTLMYLAFTQVLINIENKLKNISSMSLTCCQCYDNMVMHDFWLMYESTSHMRRVSLSRNKQNIPHSRRADQP